MLGEGKGLLQRFAEEVHLRRVSKGWSIPELAYRIGCAAKTVSRWESGSRVPREWHVRALIRELGFTEQEMGRLLGAGTSSLRYDFGCHTLAQASDLVGGWDALGDQFAEILDEFPIPKIPGNDMGSPAQWRRIYKASPDTGVALLGPGDKILGYWHCIAVRPETYERILLGENVNATLSEDDVEVPAWPGNYDMYFVDLFIRRQFNDNSTRGALRASFMGFLLECAHDGIFFRRIAAHISGAEVEGICRRLGFRETTRHKTHRVFAANGDHVASKVMELSLAQGGGGILFRQEPELHRLYSESTIEVAQ